MQPVENTKGQVGPWRPHNPPFHLPYHGEDPELAGKTALVGFTYVGGATVAQFDDVDTGYGYGWHHFHHSDFWEN